MYEPPNSELDKNYSCNNTCPKCGKEITRKDYTKIRAKRANRMECGGCGSLLKYDLKPIETLLFSGFGLFSAIFPAYYFWPAENLMHFSVKYISALIVLVAVFNRIETFYVRKNSRIYVVKHS